MIPKPTNARSKSRSYNNRPRVDRTDTGGSSVTGVSRASSSSSVSTLSQQDQSKQQAYNNSNNISDSSSQKNMKTGGGSNENSNSDRRSVDSAPSVHSSVTSGKPSNDANNGSAGSLDRIQKHSEADEEFNNEDDVLEFKLDTSDDPGIVRFSDDRAPSSPVIIRRSTKESIVSSPDSTKHNRDPLEDSSRSHTLPSTELFGDHVSKPTELDSQLPSTSSHQHTLASAFSHLEDQHNADDHGDGSNKPEEEWKDMKTVASYEVFDEKGELVVHKGLDTIGEEDPGGESNHETLDMGATKGYTRVTVDEDVKSVTSIDEKADFLFDDDELSRNPLSQLKATKDMLTDSQRIAYVGLCRLVMTTMSKEMAEIKESKKSAKSLRNARDALSMWAQQMMIRLYTHLDIAPEEQIMIEQLSDHGVLPSDLTPSLLQSAKVKNPMAEQQQHEEDEGAEKTNQDDENNEGNNNEDNAPSTNTTNNDTENNDSTSLKSEENTEPNNFRIQRPEEFKDQNTIEIDIRWTLLCDLFLVLISDSIYDSRSRILLEKVADDLKITPLEICQFERKVTDALEIEEGSIQTWDEKEIMEDRRKAALKKRYMYVGLATLGGGFVIGLSAGLLAPVIGAGLAAGFTTIGVTGTSGFLAGTGGAAVVTTTGVAVGARIGSKSMLTRMGHVKTFEFRPLHNNRRVNSIITVSGWMSGKEDDVRLPFSTVDPVMGDLFSVHWEPEMLQSTGKTINILATEVLVQSVQHLLGQTVLTTLMASLQLPMVLSKLGYLIDNPWNVSLARAWSAGLILADSLINRNLGVRPATLVGFSLGARVIYSCLIELARRGAYGLVENVFIFGAPFVVKQEQVSLARSVVSGRFVNGYSRKDWILGYLFRATSGGLGRIAGLAPMEFPLIENFDNTEIVEGHMGYRKSIPKLLKEVGFEVISEEFTEIEDPDPEKERERQKELKQELYEARKQMEEEADKEESSSKAKKFFSWFKPKKKEWWEKTEGGKEMGEAEVTDQGGDIMFDVDAIRKEVDALASGETSKGINVDKNAEVPLENTVDSDNKTSQMEEDNENIFEPAEHGFHDENGPITMTFDEDAFEDDKK